MIVFLKLQDIGDNLVVDDMKSISASFVRYEH